MALLFMDSFDHYVTADLTEKWTIQTGTQFTISASNGRRSSGCLDGNAGTSTLVTTLVPSGSVVVIGCAVRFSGYSTARCFLNATSGATAQVGIHINTDGTLGVNRGVALNAVPANILGTTSFALSLNTYYYLEVKVTLHDTAGTADLRVDGSSKLALTSLDTNNGASNLWNAVGFGTAAGVGYRVDDLYVLDGSGAAPWNDFLGDVRVDVRSPTAAGATTGWTPSTGANWQTVDDAAPNDDTDYNSAASSGLTDTFVVQDAPVAGATIYGVQECLSAKKTDAGICTLASVVRHSGTDHVGSTLSPGTAYAFLRQVYATNPGTAAAWTESDFNAAEFGVTRLT